jgi:hypothetical protein
MTVMTLGNNNHHHAVIISSMQLYSLALLVVLALAVTLTLLLALPTVESHFGNFQILPNDLAHFASIAM